MGKKQSRAAIQRRAKRDPAIANHLHRWLSAGIMATMMAISTIVVAAELPRGSHASLALDAPEVQLSSIHGDKTERDSPIQYQPGRAPLERRFLLGDAPHISQRLRRREIWQAVQNQLPDLPLENSYISSDTGDRSETNTLVRRMVEYHNFRKGRSPQSRFDWKLTLADYLGVNDTISADNYPSANKLKTNPMTGDIAAVQAMGRGQRHQLINQLVRLYNPRIPAAFFDPASPAPEPALADEPRGPSQPASQAPAQAVSNPARLPPLEEPGAADLLRPR